MSIIELNDSDNDNYTRIMLTWRLTKLFINFSLGLYGKDFSFFREYLLSTRFSLFFVDMHCILVTIINSRLKQDPIYHKFSQFDTSVNQFIDKNKDFIKKKIIKIGAFLKLNAGDHSLNTNEYLTYLHVKTYIDMIENNLKDQYKVLVDVLSKTDLFYEGYYYNVVEKEKSKHYYSAECLTEIDKAEFFFLHSQDKQKNIEQDGQILKNTNNQIVNVETFNVALQVCIYDIFIDNFIKENSSKIYELKKNRKLKDLQKNAIITNIINMIKDMNIDLNKYINEKSRLFILRQIDQPLPDNFKLKFAFIYQEKEDYINFILKVFFFYLFETENNLRIDCYNETISKINILYDELETMWKLKCLNEKDIKEKIYIYKL